MSSIDALLRKVVVQLTRPIPGGTEVRFVTQHPSYTTDGIYDIQLQRVIDIDVSTYYASLPLLPLECSPTSIITDERNLLTIYQQPIIEFCKKRSSHEISASTLQQLQSIFRSKAVYNQHLDTDQTQSVLLGSSEIDAQQYIQSNYLFLSIVNLKDAFDLIGYSYSIIKTYYDRGNLLETVKQDWEIFLNKVRTFKLYELADSYRKAKQLVHDSEVKLRALNLQTEAAISKLCRLKIELNIFDELDDVLTYWPFDGFVKTTGELVLSQDKLKVSAYTILKSHYGITPLTTINLSDSIVFNQVKQKRQEEILSKISTITADIHKELETVNEQESSSLKEVLSLFDDNTREAMTGLAACSTLFAVLQYWPGALAPAPSYVLQQA